MRIASRPEEIPKNATATVGNFDGVHLGHQFLLEELARREEPETSESLLVTFDPPPLVFFQPSSSRLSTREEKIELLRAKGLRNVLILEFTADFAQTEPRDFVKDLLVDGLQVREVVVGETHRFGRDKAGDIELLKKLGRQYRFSVDVVDPVIHGELPISSSRVRAALRKGEVEETSSMLGRSYSFVGEVVKGVGRGRELEYPTANLAVDEAKILPGDGVYAVVAEVDGQETPAVMNIGSRPTFGSQKRSVEVHLLDFSGDIYGQRVSVYCVKRLRDEKAFSNGKLLASQIDRDVRIARKHL
jgi:riboflavin kinase/FMN adenylyltransferase